jgi:hypothetical protein
VKDESEDDESVNTEDEDFVNVSGNLSLYVVTVKRVTVGTTDGEHSTNCTDASLTYFLADTHT